MNAIFDLSFRYKIPIWGTLLIMAATLSVSAALILQAYDDLQSDSARTSTALGQTLVQTLFPAMQQDEVWRAFEIIRAPLHGDAAGNLARPDMIVALDNVHQVFVSSHPREVPMLTDWGASAGDQAQLVQLLGSRAEAEAGIVEFSGALHSYVAVPIASEGLRLGTLVLIHSNDMFLPRFRATAWRSAQVGLVVLAVLLPINWYWGQRTAAPLVKLARSAANVSRGDLSRPAARIYPYKDELGQLFVAFSTMVDALREKQLLEHEMVRSERLAAIGRLSAGLAHEINNPLAGMLVAIDNFKRRGGQDERTLKTVAMLERGLSQIRDTVGAVLVQASVKARPFAPDDIEDVRTLLAGEAHKRGVSLEVKTNVAEPIGLPAAPVRQVLVNLLLNAVQASARSGTVHCSVQQGGHRLTIDTRNAGRAIAPELMAHLFEPFVGTNESGHGLGLWVTYQVVTQLGGRIAADQRDGLTCFHVSLPIGELDG